MGMEMITQSFTQTIQALYNRYSSYADHLQQLPVEQRRIDFEKEPDLDAILRFMRIPRFSLFSDFFVNNDVKRGTAPAVINAYHSEASTIIPQTYNRVWQFARRTDYWVTLEEIGTGSLNPEFFIDFCAAARKDDIPNELLDQTLLRFIREVEAFEYAPKKELFSYGKRAERSSPVPLDEEPHFIVQKEEPRKGVVWYTFGRIQGNIELTTPWRLDSSEPPLLRIERGTN